MFVQEYTDKKNIAPLLSQVFIYRREQTKWENADQNNAEYKHFSRSVI